MTVIVDANVVFSAILNTQGKIADLLINSSGHISFVAPDFLRTEIRKYHSKLAKASKLPIDTIREIEFKIYKDITFISEEQISQLSWQSAFELVKDIDPQDIAYVAYSIEFGYKIWSGDKVLIKGLQKKRFLDVLTTDQLHEIRDRDKRISK